MWFAWLLWLAHKNSIASEALIVIGDVHLSLFALTSLQTFLKNTKNRFLLKILPTKPSFFFKSDRLT